MPNPERSLQPVPTARRPPATPAWRCARRLIGRAGIVAGALLSGGCSSLAWLRLPYALSHAGHGLLPYYVPAALLAVLLAHGVRERLRGPAPRAGAALPALTRYEAAYLAGGEARVVEVACASLAQRGWLITTQDWTALKPTRICGTPDDPVERAVLAALAQDGRPAHLRRVAALRIGPALHRRLLALGLLLDARALARVQRWPALCTGSVAALGVAGVVTGLVQQRPVVSLALASVSLAVTTLLFAARPNPRSRPGEALLATLREQYAPVPSMHRNDPALALTLAVCGAASVRACVPGGVGHVLAPRPDEDGNIGLDAGIDLGSFGGDDGGDSGGDGCGGGCSG